MFLPELPNFPLFTGGRVNADASNHRLMLRSEDARFPLRTRSGVPPMVLVFDGSVPAKAGVRYSPVWMVYTAVSCQPPKSQFTGPLTFRNRRPAPNGISQTVCAKNRWRGLNCTSLFS